MRFLKNSVSTVYMRTGAPYLCSDELISLSENISGNTHLHKLISNPTAALQCLCPVDGSPAEI